MASNPIQFAGQYWIVLVWIAGLAYLARFRTTRLYREVLAGSEWVLTGTLAICAIALQVAYWTHAGGLWRDEANSINLATVPRIRDLWDHLDGDSFPLLWLLVLRGWAWMGLAGSDLSIRALSLLISFGILAAIFWIARRSGVAFPIISLLFVACNPVFVRCVGANRAYGLGILLLLAVYGAIGAILRNPFHWTRFAGACVLAILAVQCMYFNTVFLWMITGSAVIVSLCRKDKARAAACAGIGLIATATMLPYIVIVHKQQEWSGYITTPPRLDEICHVLSRVLESQGPFTFVVSVSLTIIALTFSIRYLMRHHEEMPAHSDRDRVLFSALCLMLCGVGNMAFLWMLKYNVQTWYFAAFLAVAGVSLDTLIAVAMANDEVRRTARVAFACVIGLASLATTQQSALARQTNIDIVAFTLQATSSAKDRIIVVPWYFGTTFDRYYHGSAEWETVPALDYYRYDFVRNMVRAVKREQTIEKDLGRIRLALQSGGRVSIVGELPQGHEKRRWVPDSKEHRQLDACLISWYTQIRSELTTHSTLLSNVRVDNAEAIRPIEDAGIETWSGWHDAPGSAKVRPQASVVVRDREQNAP